MDPDKVWVNARLVKAEEDNRQPNLSDKVCGCNGLEHCSCPIFAQEQGLGSPVCQDVMYLACKGVHRAVVRIKGLMVDSLAYIHCTIVSNRMQC